MEKSHKSRSSYIKQEQDFLDNDMENSTRWNRMKVKLLKFWKNRKVEKKENDSCGSHY